jgi:hypothetical protein
VQSLWIEVFHAPSHRGPIIEGGLPLFTELATRGVPGSTVLLWHFWPPQIMWH